MKKEEIQLDMRVSVSGMGRGTVVDLMPEGKFFVKVYFDGDSKKHGGKTVPADVHGIKLLPPPKPTREEKERARYDSIRKTPESYYLAGIIAVGPSRIHVSTPPKQFQTTQDELSAHGVEFDDDVLTQSTDRTQGRSISVLMPSHTMADKYEQLTGVHSTPYQGRSDTFSVQAKPFIMDFLLDNLKFRLGTKQNIEEVRKLVPQEFQASFQQGVDVGLGESLMQNQI